MRAAVTHPVVTHALGSDRARQATPWYHAVSQVSVNVNGVEVVGPEVERDATLLRDSECRPESAGQTAVCVDNALADLLPGANAMVSPSLCR